LATIRPSLVTVLIKRGDRLSGGAGRPTRGDGWAGWRGLTGAVEAAACANGVSRYVNLSREDSPRLWDRFPLSASDSLPAAAMTASSGVTAGAEMYLCLWKTVLNTLVARVSFIHMVQAQ